MGMSIDKTIEFFNGLECHTPQAKDARDVAIDTMRKYQHLQANYETRLKADMVAMLTDLWEQMEEIPDSPIFDSDTELIADGFGKGVFQCQKIIQQKIDALRGETDE